MHENFGWKPLTDRSFGGPVRKWEKNNTVYIMEY
jgi:hypothetical protein